IVDRVNNNDTFEVKVEMTPEQFTDKVSEILAMEKSLAGALKVMLGINPAVKLVAPKTIARSEGKAVRVIDKRKLV
ncbi:MAG: phenylacetate--CoA ligase, partial [Clostridia bacterium]|nr:phenylacetate--CoA ligase [Clostridia bacterium]